MFITEAFAQQPAAPGGGSMLIQLLPFVLILAIMYFLIIRPQQKRLKEHREMIASIKRNDTVVTAGGMVGKVTKIVNDNELQVELAEGVRVRVVRSTIAEVRTRGDVREVESRKARNRQDDDNDVDDDDLDGEEEERPARKSKAANTNRPPADGGAT